MPDSDNEFVENRDVPVLKGITLDIEEGSHVAILGHNGSGKSTLAKLLNLILVPTAGKLTIGGKEIDPVHMTEEELLALRNQIGMVFQNPDNQLVATIVEEDVAFGPENLGVPMPELRHRVEEALDIVGMRAYARHEPHRLSGGQKQRIAIAGIIAMRPRCMIFDESTAMLDPIGRKDVMATIRRLNREQGITVLTITHFMDEAVQADRVIVLDDGNVLLDGTPAEVFSRPEELAAAGLDVPQCTALMVALQKRGIPVEGDFTTPESCAQSIRDALARSGRKEA